MADEEPALQKEFEELEKEIAESEKTPEQKKDEEVKGIYQELEEMAEQIKEAEKAVEHKHHEQQPLPADEPEHKELHHSEEE